MAVIDLVKWNGSPNLLAWKFPSEELSTYTQLIVNETQEAFVVHGGVYDGPFGSGRHTLTTENIPLIRNLLGLPFGDRTPFSAEVWFVNKITNLNIKWGTPYPIQLKDPQYQIMVPVRSFGQYGIKIGDSKKFLMKLVGTLGGFDVDILTSYFNGIFATKIKTEIANSIIKSGYSVLDISTQLENLSLMLRDAFKNEMADYGVVLTQFNIHSINVPEDNPAVNALRAALAKKAEMSIVGFTYQQERSFDVLQTAAGNEGSAGSVMGAGLGLGMGAGVGGQIAQTMGQVVSTAATNISAPPGVGHSQSPQQQLGETPRKMGQTEKIQLLKDLAELKNQGILSEEEFIKEKQKILEN